MIKRRNQARALLLPVLILAGCVTYRPNDVAVVSVAAVDRYDELVARRESERRAGQTGFHNHPIVRRTELKVSITTTTNLLEFAREWDNVSVRGYRCDTGPADSYVFASRVHWRGREIENRWGETAEQAADLPAQERYEIYLSVDGRPLNIQQRVIPGYDLAAEPFDICLQLLGGNMVGLAFRSNAVSIPREVVVKALAEPPMAAEQ